MNFGPRPVWSPNNDLLAYYAVENEALYLKVWDRKKDVSFPPRVPVDKAGVAETAKTSMDTGQSFRALFFQWNPPVRLWEEQEGDNYTARLRAELVGQRPAINTKTLLGTPALAPSLRPQYEVDSSGRKSWDRRASQREKW